MKIGFIPIDNRPVCYTLPKQIADIDKNIEFFIPERNLLGSLEKYADTDGIFEWIKTLPKLDAMVVSLDTIAYGGLIPSRRRTDGFNEIKKRIDDFKRIINAEKIYAFSSIMRISNNNINQEEKEYWASYGKKIFEYSYNLDKYGTTETDLPSDILDDYTKTRERNFEINKIYLEWQKEGFFDTLVFSKDDCAQFGLNVREAKELERLGGFVKTGADEIPLTLLARAINKKIKIKPVFLEPEFTTLISNYEDVSVEKSVLGQLDLGGFEISDTPDLTLYINNFKEHQGEIVMKVPTKEFSGVWEAPQGPYMIADVRFANGGDNALVGQFKPFGENFYGYSAWNTTANTLGSLLCAAKIKYNAEKTLTPNPSLKERGAENFKKLQITRLLDDWAYQANVRQMLEKPDSEQCKKLMKPFEEKVFKLVGMRADISYSFPWNRLFEVEIEFN